MNRFTAHVLGKHRIRLATFAGAILAILAAVCAIGILGEKGFAQEEAQAQEDSLERDYSDELPRIPPKEPREVLETFETHPDFEMQLVAAEPLVKDPIAMAFDEDGRLFVVEMRGYSEERDEMIGAVRMLTDTDGDGTYDESTAYVDGLAWPTAVACYDGGIFVGVAPDILYCKDTNGDGQADIQKKVFTGFGLSNVQGLLNTFKWGLDNRIHGVTSSSGAEVRPADDPRAMPLTLRNRDFSFNPRTLAMTAESGGGQYGMTFDSWGRKYVCSNSRHNMMIMYEDRYAARNPYYAAPNPLINIAADGAAGSVYRISEVEPWRVVRTRLRVQGLVPGPVEGGGTASGYFTGVSGITVYRGDAWPSGYVGQSFVGEVSANLIHRDNLDPSGVEMVADRVRSNTEFVRSTDNWFRPSQFCNAPDGTLYVADMYREIVEHPDSLPSIIKQHLDLTSGRDRGRIYRVVPKGFSQPEIPKLSTYSDAELVPLLTHANGWHRQTASRLLYERRAVMVAPAIEELARRAERPEGRVRALYTLDSLGELYRPTVMHALDAEHPRVREHAIRLAERFLLDGVTEDDQQLVEKLLGMAGDPDPRVRYQLAFTLGYIESDPRNQTLADIARNDGGDRWFRVAIMSSAFQGAPGIFNALITDDAFRQKDSGQQLIEELAVQVGATGSETAIASALDAADALPEAHATLARNTVRGLINGIKLSGQGGDLHEILAKSHRASELLEETLNQARKVAMNTDIPVDERVNAIETLALAAYDQGKQSLTPLLDQTQPVSIQSAALESLGRFSNPQVASIILERWPKLSPQLRSQAIEVLFARTEWTSRLLDAMEEGVVQPTHLTSTRIHALRTHAEADLRNRAEEILDEYTLGNRADVVEQYRDVLDIEGKPERGKQLFAENCAECHQLQGQGHSVGPDLAAVAQSGAEKILVNILDPNREVNPQYINYIVETSDWETHSGIITSETATSITLLRANGAEETILRVNIDKIQSTNMSLMPEGWEESLSKQDLADLIEYLTSLE